MCLYLFVWWADASNCLYRYKYIYIELNWILESSKSATKLTLWWDSFHLFSSFWDFSFLTKVLLKGTFWTDRWKVKMSTKESVLLWGISTSITWILFEDKSWPAIRCFPAIHTTLSFYPLTQLLARKFSSHLCPLSPQHCDDFLLHGVGSGHDAAAALPLLSGLCQPAERCAICRHHYIAVHDPHTLRRWHPHQLLQATVCQDHHKG